MKVIEEIANYNEYYAIACYDENRTIIYLDENGLYYNFPDFKLDNLSETFSIIRKLKNIVPYKCFPVKIVESYKTIKLEENDN